MSRPVSRFAALAAVLCAVAATALWAQVVRNGPLPAPLPLFPSDNWWNVDITSAPVDPSDAAWKTYIGGEGMHPDFGAEGEFEPEIYGIPFISVPGTQPLKTVTWSTDWDQSDDGARCRAAGYPIPDEAKAEAKWIEGGYPGNVDIDTTPRADGDRHMLIVDRDNHILYELFYTFWNTAANHWEAASGAIFLLDEISRRPDGWTSSEAAGLALLPGLVRRDEAYGANPIKHAFRVTLHGVCGYVFPASHLADTGCPNAPPLGARMRLKADRDISGYPPHMQKIFQAMKTYGLVVADTGTDMYITGTYDPLWDNGELNPYFDDFDASDFDFIARGWHPADPPVTREQFASQVLRQQCSPGDPSPCTGWTFTDAACTDSFAKWLKEADDHDILSPCAVNRICPKQGINHAQLAMFLLRVKHNGAYVPPACPGATLTDVSCAHPYATWIYQARSEGLVNDCAAGRYCPDEAVTRLELKQLLANSFYP
jgi:hypothetical protein